MRNRMTFAPLALGVVVTILPACGSSKSQTAQTPGQPAQAPVAQAAPEPTPERAPEAPGTTLVRTDPSPIAADGAVLNVAGLSCPKCANNVTLQLREIVGVDGITIDMNSGDVALTFRPMAHPSPMQLARAIDNTGFTLVSMRTN